MVEQFLCENELELIIRGSQIVEEGYEFSCSNKLVTIFSSPNYIGEFDNKASVPMALPGLILSLVSYCI